MLIGGGGANSALPHGASQQVCNPAGPSHIHSLQEAHRCGALVIMRYLLSKPAHELKMSRHEQRSKTSAEGQVTLG